MGKGELAHRFEPDYAIHPGEILAETLQARKIKKVDLANRCDLSTKHISKIINGKDHISPAIAIQLERALGISAEVWSNLDAQYRLHGAKLQELGKLEEAACWARRFPLKELAKRGFLSAGGPMTETVSGLLNFLGVAGIEAYRRRYDNLIVAYRKSPKFRSSAEAVTAWLRIGDLRAERTETGPYNKKEFERVLEKARTLTVEEPAKAWGRIIEMCRGAGVALVFEPELPGTRLSGASWWLNLEKAIIMLSLRHKKDDFLWFDFYHEAGHLLLHGKKDVFIEDTEMGTNDKEGEADRFAWNWLIPDEKYAAFIARRGPAFMTANAIKEFAGSIGIAPGIVVGRLQHDGVIAWSAHNGLKRGIELGEGEDG